MVWLLTGCRQAEETDITIQWNGKRATGLSIPNRFIQPIATDSLDQLLTIRLDNQETAVAGQYQVRSDGVLFEPLVPFTRGLHYGVWLRNKRLAAIGIPTLGATDHPELLAIYPSPDSLPDNLLKLYLHFSRPMREGHSKQYVALLKNNTDTLPNVFLDLQPELWNADRTLLTLWLDPGRIKRDLQPNKRLGTPLQTNVRYRLVVAAAWPDEQGATLGKPFFKTFVTVQRDTQSPNPKHWSVRTPKAGSLQPLDISFGELLDYSLLTETLRIIGEDGKRIPGAWGISAEEKQASFVPATNWQPGQYKLRIESRLEDLAGNNLNRPFDRDITRKDQPATSLPFTELVVSIHE